LDSRVQQRSFRLQIPKRSAGAVLNAARPPAHERPERLLFPLNGAEQFDKGPKLRRLLGFSTADTQIAICFRSTQDDNDRGHHGFPFRGIPSKERGLKVPAIRLAQCEAGRPDPIDERESEVRISDILGREHPDQVGDQPAE
jgi:hypothetical protein